MQTSTYRELPEDTFWFKTKFRDKNIIIGISNINDYDTTEFEKEKYKIIIEKVYNLYLEEWKSLFQENKIQILDIVLNIASTATSSSSNRGGSLHFKEETCTPIPANITINYADLTMEVMIQNIDSRIFPRRWNSRKYFPSREEDAEYNRNSSYYHTEIYIPTYTIKSHTINEIKQEIKQKLSKKYINSERLNLQKNLEKYISNVANKLTEKYSLDYKDAVDFVTRSNDDEWIFEYKTTKYDVLTDNEYWKIAEDTGYNKDCDYDSYEENCFTEVLPRSSQYVRDRTMKQLVGIRRK